MIIKVIRTLTGIFIHKLSQHWPLTILEMLLNSMRVWSSISTEYMVPIRSTRS